jgi:hypothetical protein
VDLVDEEDVALLHVGQQAGEVAGLLDDGAGGDADVAAELVAEDEGQGGLAEARRAGEEDVVERLAAALGGADHHLEALDGLGLAGEIGEGQRAQRRFGRRDGRGERVGDEIECPWELCRREAFLFNDGFHGMARMLDLTKARPAGTRALQNRLIVVIREIRRQKDRVTSTPRSAPRLRRFSTKFGWRA